MKLAHRFAYYFGGFSIGILFLLFFLNGKNASCAYGPNARTVKNITSKPIHYSDKASNFITKNALDSLTIRDLIKYGDVDFSRSQTRLDSCNIYQIQNSFKAQEMELKIRNCESIATILDIFYTHI